MGESQPSPTPDPPPDPPAPDATDRGDDAPDPGLSPRLSLRERLWAAVPTTGLSLANKCLLLFGGAVILIVAVALVLPLLRMNALVERGQLELSRHMADAWLAAGGADAATSEPRTHAGILARRVPIPQPALSPLSEEADPLHPTEPPAPSPLEPSIESARGFFESHPRADERQIARWEDSSLVYTYARAIRRRPAAPPLPAPTLDQDQPAPLAAIVLIERRAEGAGVMFLFNTAYLFSAGLVVLGLALLVFYFITNRIILSPVRGLRDTAQRVREGDLAVRSDITTNDEFEELAETFNAMLADLEQTQSQQRAINAALDLKVSELAEANVLLYEAARMKGEFVANVSHELRTPLNSIIGFAELLLDIAKADARTLEDTGQAVPPPMAKRQRYLENILTGGRNLLALIEDLLEMAKIEAGRVEVRPQAVNIRDACDAIAGLIQPLADRKGVRLDIEPGPDLPLVTTDPKRLHQILFNFLSNAVKFSPSRPDGPPPRVILRAERLPPAADDVGQRVRLSVIDEGPGIPAEEHARIFEKFHQLERSENKQPGTGLGLSICKELAAVLQGEIQLVSDLGSGSMFSLILPVHFDPARTAETNMERRFRTALAGRASF
ncbi:MAG: HAMP domain-containing histidine kinase [Phycisphaeraceae bacterium]|nr:HAMP domain-containing histidine kinase [Phycisphaeraceae bacterium]